MVASLQEYILLKIKLIHRPLFQHDSTHCRNVSLFQCHGPVKNTWNHLHAIKLRLEGYEVKIKLT